MTEQTKTKKEIETTLKQKRELLATKEGEFTLLKNKKEMSQQAKESNSTDETKAENLKEGEVSKIPQIKDNIKKIREYEKINGTGSWNKKINQAKTKKEFHIGDEFEIGKFEPVNNKVNASENKTLNTLEQLESKLAEKRTIWLAAESKYKSEQNKISKLTSFLAGDQTKLGNTKLGKKIGVDNEKSKLVEKAQTAYDKAYAEYRIAKNTNNKSEMGGKSEKEITNELKKIAIEESNKEYNEVQTERGNNIASSTLENSNKRSKLLGKAILLGNATWSGAKTALGVASKTYNKVVDKIDGGRSITFKIPWGKDENGERKYIESKYRIGKLVISAGIAGLTVGGPEMWIRVARSLTIAVGSGFGLNYVTKKHEEDLAALKSEMNTLEEKLANKTISQTEYTVAKQENEAAVANKEKWFKVKYYAILGGAIGTTIGSSMLEKGLGDIDTNQVNPNINSAKVEDFYKLPKYLNPDIHVENSPLDPNPPPQDLGVVDTNLEQAQDTLTNTAPIDTAQTAPTPILSADSTIVEPTDSNNLIKSPLSQPADSTTVEPADTGAVAKTPVVRTEDPAATIVDPDPVSNVIEQPNDMKLEVKMSSKGALETVRQLKASLKDLYPNPADAPANIQHILETDYTTLTKEWGMFNPDNPDESAWMLAGKGDDVSKLMVDENGKVILHNFSKGDTILSGDGSTVYEGKMFDSDHQGTGTTRLNGGVDINQAPDELTEGGVDINQAPDELTKEGFNLMQTPEGIDDQSLFQVPTSNSTPEEILKFMKEHPNTVVRDPNTGLPYNPSDLYEKTTPEFITQSGHEIHLNDPAYKGHSVVMGGDNKIYIDNQYSDTLTKEFLQTKSSVVDETTARWFSWSRKGETYPEWKALQGKSMNSLVDPEHDFANVREERLLKKMLKLSKQEGISYQGKTMAQLVNEVAMKRMEQVG